MSLELINDINYFLKSLAKLRKYKKKNSIYIKNRNLYFKIKK